MLDSRAQREGQPSMGSALQVVRERQPSMGSALQGAAKCRRAWPGATYAPAWIMRG